MSAAQPVRGTQVERDELGAMPAALQVDDRASGAANGPAGQSLACGRALTPAPGSPGRETVYSALAQRAVLARAAARGHIPIEGGWDRIGPVADDSDAAPSSPARIAPAIAPRRQVCGETTDMRGSGAGRAKDLGADGRVRPSRVGIREERARFRVSWKASNFWRSDSDRHWRARRPEHDNLGGQKDESARDTPGTRRRWPSWAPGQQPGTTEKEESCNDIPIMGPAPAWRGC